MFRLIKTYQKGKVAIKACVIVILRHFEIVGCFTSISISS